MPVMIPSKRERTSDLKEALEASLSALPASPEPTWRSERHLLKPLCAAALSALMVLGAAEAAARLVLSQLALPHSYDVPRNPMIDLGWVPFTAPRPRAAHEKLIVVISNSQGFGREIEDADQIYAARLEQRLNARANGRRYIVANWSMNGGLAPDMILLAARAAAHAPDAVLVPTYCNSVLDARIEHPDYLNNRDVQYLGYEPQVRRLLSPAFLHHFWLSRPRGWLTAASGLLRLHHLFMMPGHTVVFGRVKWPPGVGQTPHDWQPRGEEMLKELAETLQRGAPKTPLVLVSMPIDLNRFTPESRPRLQAYATHLHRVMDGRPSIRVWDAVEAIPSEAFCAPTHFWAQGHAQFADWLAPQVAALMAN